MEIQLSNQAARTEMENKALFKSSRHGPRLVFCKFWSHPAVSYNFCSLSNSVRIPICTDHMRWSLGLMTTEGMFLLQFKCKILRVAIGTFLL